MSLKRNRNKNENKKRNDRKPATSGTNRTKIKRLHKYVGVDSMLNEDGKAAVVMFTGVKLSGKITISIIRNTTPD